MEEERFDLTISRVVSPHKDLPSENAAPDRVPLSKIAIRYNYLWTEKLIIVV